MDDQLKDFVNKNRPEFDFRLPSSELRTSVLTILRENEKLKRRRVFRARMSIAAAVATILGLSALMLSRIPESGTSDQITESITVKDQKESKTNENVAQTTVTPPANLEKQIIGEPPNSKPDLRVANVLKKEDTDHVLAFMLSEDRPPSDRINSLKMISDLEDIGEDLLEQVTETAVDDENTNVRLAAVGVLVSKSRMPQLHEHLISAFIEQDDPIVQSELIDIITVIDNVSRDPKVRKRLNEISNDPLAEGFVRERALVLLMEEGK